MATGRWRRSVRGGVVWLTLAFGVHASAASGEVTAVRITSREVVAGGQSFGSVGTYERLVGEIEFALDPANPHNRGIVDLRYAPRAADGRVHFTSSLIVFRPVDASKGNGVLFFEVANRGNMAMIRRFNRGRPGSNDIAAEAFGDGLLMRDGYTIVGVGWELDVPAPLLRVLAPLATLPAGSTIAAMDAEIMVNAKVEETFLIDDPAGRPPVIYPPSDPESATDVLTVRDRYFDTGAVVPRNRWHFVAHPSGLPRIRVDDGLEPGRYYRLAYRASRPQVAGVGLAAIRDAAAAFRYRTDLPIHGTSAYAFGVSQTGRFLRTFLYEGFNADERERRVFDAVWAHIAGAARGSFNERFATPVTGDVFKPTVFPFTDAEEADIDGTRGGLQARYRPEQRPKVFYTNTPVEYWGGGRAAALTHTSVDGTRDLILPDNVRSYLLSGTMHGVGPFPPERTAAGGGSVRSGGRELNNPTPQDNVMRALLRALYRWTAEGMPPPASRYPRLSDGTLVQSRDVRFPLIASRPDPRTITGPARVVGGQVRPLPHLVPQVDENGLDLGGIRDPEVAVPLATTTGWNFRADAVGNPGDIYQLLGSYIPFAKTATARTGSGDPRRSIEERYPSEEEYLRRVQAASDALIRDGYMLREDLAWVMARARAHWAFAVNGAQ